MEEKYVIERTSKFADFPIEVHILSVLWIIYSGRYLQPDIHSASYANVLDFEFLNHKSEPSENLKLFKPYFVEKAYKRPFSSCNKPRPFFSNSFSFAYPSSIRGSFVLLIDLRNRWTVYINSMT